MRAVLFYKVGGHGILQPPFARWQTGNSLPTPAGKKGCIVLYEEEIMKELCREMGITWTKEQGFPDVNGAAFSFICLTSEKAVMTIDLEGLEQERVRLLKERIDLHERLIHKRGKAREKAKAELEDLNAQYAAVSAEMMKLRG